MRLNWGIPQYRNHNYVRSTSLLVDLLKFLCKFCFRGHVGFILLGLQQHSSSRYYQYCCSRDNFASQLIFRHKFTKTQFQVSLKEDKKYNENLKIYELKVCILHSLIVVFIRTRISCLLFSSSSANFFASWKKEINVDIKGKELSLISLPYIGWITSSIFFAIRTMGYMQKLKRIKKFLHKKVWRMSLSNYTTCTNCNYFTFSAIMSASFFFFFFWIALTSSP